MTNSGTSDAGEARLSLIRMRLAEVEDPVFGKDVLQKRIVRDLALHGDKLSLTIAKPTPFHPADEVERRIRAALRESGPSDIAARVILDVPEAQALLSKNQIPGVKNVVAVSSGKGGVGKSTVAVNLACALARAGASVGILDADVYGPNVPIMLGASGTPTGEQGKIQPIRAHGMQVMSMAFLVPEEQPVIWRGPMLHSAMKQFLFDVQWGQLDYLLVDLPPGTGDAQLSLAQQSHLMGAVVVTTPQDVSVLDVRKAIKMFEQVNVPVLGIVENMAGLVLRGRAEGATAGLEVDGSDGPQRVEVDAEGRFETTIDVFGVGGGAKIAERYGIP
ncbi:MAG TPA: Mrp/NBP35 family ATP-binding protein, partial [Planctomycetota bacterium]|nr:Mrp/NBP35 family ATP-binding protein [Planctomycetota bacterium]